MGTTIGTYVIDEIDVEVTVSSAILPVGESIAIELQMRGTNRNLEINELDLVLRTRYQTENGYQHVSLGQFTLATDFSIESGLTEIQEATLTVPYRTPGTVGSVDVVAELVFDIGQSTVTHEEYLDVEPTARFQAVLDAMIDFGFAVQKIECRADPSDSDRSFYRRLVFRPVTKLYDGEVDEVQLLVRDESDELVLLPTVDHHEVPDSWLNESSEAVHIYDKNRLRERLRPAVEQCIRT